MSKITACIPCYNDYPYIMLSVQSASEIFDKVLVSDCSDDNYTYKSLIENFSDHSNVEIIRSEKWLDWVENRNVIRNKVDTEYCMWMDANDVFCENMKDTIRSNIFKSDMSKAWCPTTIRTYGSFQTSDRYNIKMSNGKKKDPFQVDPCHFAIPTNMIHKWGYNKKKNLGGAVPYDIKGLVSGGHRYKFTSEPCMYHLHGFGTKERNRVRKILKDFILNKKKMFSQGYKSPLDKIIKTNDLPPKPFVDRNNLTMLNLSKLPKLPKSISEEIVNNKYYNFMFDSKGIPIRRQILYNGKVVEESSI